MIRYPVKTTFAICALTLATLSACGGGGSNDSTVPTPVPTPATNTAPVAQAGASQNIVAGTVVTLDGSTSSDKDGDTLTYAWALTSRPAGSIATLSSATAVKPTFTADVAGAYIATLTVNDGKTSSIAATVTITASVVNAAPVANPGIGQNVVAGSPVTLDGSASTDANNDPLTYAWVLTRPTLSVATLASSTTAKPTFTADVAGDYIATLIVNDGKINSAPLSVTITATVANAAPVANAGSAQSLLAGNVVTLDGSTSSDANGDPLIYAWVLTSKPAGSNAALSNVSSAKPTFTADVAGLYVASLVVNDGKVSSAASTVQITAAAVNAAPVANAGIAQNAVTGTSISLNGSASSDANGDPLTYAWSLTSKPAGSSLTFSSTAAKPVFTADVPGTYVFTLTVNDGKLNSTPATVAVTAAAANVAPVANAGSAQNVVTGAAVTLNGSASSDANGDTLTYAWTWVSKPTGSAATLLSANTAQPSFTADMEGTYVASLIVNDGKVNSPAINVAVTAITNTLMLFQQETSIINGTTETKLTLPYTSVGAMQNSCVGSCSVNYTIGTFKLTAVGANFTVTSLSATDSTNTVAPTFGGLSQSQVISAGSSAVFTLLSPKTSNATAKLTYRFVVAETGQVFSYSVDFKSN